MTTAPSIALRTARTVPLPDPGPLLTLLPAGAPLCWVGDGVELVGWGEVDRLEVSGVERFAEAERWWRDLVGSTEVEDEVGASGTGPVVFGSFSFDERETSVLIVPEVVVGRSADRCWVTRLGADGIPVCRQSAPPAPGAVRFADGALSSASWAAVVGEVVQRITAGELAKVVLARDLEACTERPLDLRWPLLRLAERYPGCRTFCVDGLLGATPEILIRLEHGWAASRVLAGTIRRTGSHDRDVLEAASLSGSSKDLEEHEYAVQSVADALARYSSHVQTPSAPFVLHLPNVMHLASDITARVEDGVTSLGLVAALHPSAAVCGTPSTVAMDVIREVEQMSRGRYAGPVGWMDARGDGEWGLALRSAELDPEDPCRLRLFAGCGIVAGSAPEDELAESVAKLIPMRDALSG